jgi:hypothetical protein
MKCVNATKFHRKSVVAQWRDLQFSGPFLEMFFYSCAVHSTSQVNQRLQILSADSQRLFPMRQINFKLPVLHFHTHRSVIPGTPKRAQKTRPIDIPASRKLRSMELERISQNPHLIQLLAVDCHILQVNPEDAR